VLAAGLNNTDINTRIGWYGAALDAAPAVPTAPNAPAVPMVPAASVTGWNGATPFPLIQGADCCGRVVAFAPDVPAGPLAGG